MRTTIKTASQTQKSASYKKTFQIIWRRSSLLMIPLVLIISILLASCGTGTGTTSTGAGSTPTKPPVATTGTINGCPSNAINPTPGKPNVTIQFTNSHGTIKAHNGDLIEVRLPFGHAWSGPFISGGILQTQSPAGYELPSAKMCIWHFIAQGTGTTHLAFSAKAICKKGEMCPLYIQYVPFTVVVQ